MEEPLFIFLDLEAAHGNNYFGDIIEIAAQVDPRVLEKEMFSSLINTNQNLSYFALKISKITKDDLRGQRYFADVFQDFIVWISRAVLKSNQFTKKLYFPVLVAHGGFDNDFMMLQSNLDRHEVGLELLNQFKFADTYHLAKQLKCKDICDLWKSQLSIEMMFKHFFPDESFEGQHRAMADVEFMIKIFLQSPLKEHFDKISIAVFEDRKEDYVKRNTSKAERNLLYDNLPKGMAKVTHKMTLSRLLRNGLTYSRLISFFESAQCTYDFYDKLKDMGIERKASKSVAAHLLTMGYYCRGAIEKEQRIETGTKEDVNYNSTDETKKSFKIKRTDSGYDSIDLKDKDWLNHFYSMFVNEFYYPPENYEYQFGSFTIEEIEEMDIFIDELFEELFGEDFNEVDIMSNHELSLKEDNNTYLTFSKRDTEGIVDLEKFANYDVEEEVEEDWEAETCDAVEFHLQAPVKNIPIGMTMNDVSGREFEERVSLLKHFNTFDMSNAPETGLPEMTRSQKNHQKWKSKKKRKEQQNLSFDSNTGSGKTYGKTDKGEIIILV